MPSYRKSCENAFVASKWSALNYACATMAVLLGGMISPLVLGDAFVSCRNETNTSTTSWYEWGVFTGTDSTWSQNFSFEPKLAKLADCGVAAAILIPYWLLLDATLILNIVGGCKATDGQLGPLIVPPILVAAVAFCVCTWAVFSVDITSDNLKNYFIFALSPLISTATSEACTAIAREYNKLVEIRGLSAKIK